VKRLIERVTRGLVRRGIRDGLLGGNGIWLALGAVSWLVRWLSRVPSQRVVREQIRVGETITITSVPAPPFGRKARKLAKRERKLAKAARRQVRGERKAAAELVSAPAEAEPAPTTKQQGSAGEGRTRRAKA
jgi:hypothetical protein